MVVVATALPHCALALTSAYLAEPAGDIAASHLLIASDGPRGAVKERGTKCQVGR